MDNNKKHVNIMIGYGNCSTFVVEKEIKTMNNLSIVASARKVEKQKNNDDVYHENLTFVKKLQRIIRK